MHTHTHTRRLSRTHVHACTHTQSPAQLFMGSGQGSRGGKTGGVRSRPPSPPHPTPPHPTAREPPCPVECFGVKWLKSRPAPEGRSAPPSFSVSLKAGRKENLLPRKGRCQGTVAASTHVRPWSSHAWPGFPGLHKGGDSFGLTRRRVCPSASLPIPQPPSSARGRRGRLKVETWNGWVGRITIQ